MDIKLIIVDMEEVLGGCKMRELLISYLELVVILGVFMVDLGRIKVLFMDL